MCRLVGWVSERRTTLQEVIGHDALSRLLHLSTVHSDGWGAAWHDPDSGQLVVQHSALPAGADEAFAAFATGTASRTCLVHLRLGTPGYGIGATSLHPFVDGQWAFAHNGAILPTSAIGDLLPPQSRRQPRGATDSERYFLALRDEMDCNGGSVPLAMRALLVRLQSANLTAASLNSILIGPDALNVVSKHDPAWQAGPIPVWPADILAQQNQPAYFPLSWRNSSDEVAIASSGIVDPEEPWQALPNNAVVSINCRSHQATVTHISP